MIFSPDQKKRTPGKCLEENDVHFRMSSVELENVFQEDAGSKKSNIQCPFRLPSQQLQDILMRPGMETALDAWRSRKPSTPGELREIQDGRIWKTIKGPDGKPFFDNNPGREDAHELKMAITIGFDGFGFKRSQFGGGSHSSGVLSSCIANLEYNLKYRPRNLLIWGLTPGPHEFNSEQLQVFMKEFVNDLLRLYDEGMIVQTPPCPEGRLVRVILIGVSADHPAACKVCGFGDHNHNKRPCPGCCIEHGDIRTEDGMNDKFPPRDGEAHRRLAREYVELNTADKKTRFRDTGSSWYELPRLPYFDAVRMTMVDPMHSILLGIVKSQWYDSWIKTNILHQRTETSGMERELDEFHRHPKDMEIPSWVAKVPKMVGYPAGGSLTADEWKGIALVLLPAIIPFIWGYWGSVERENYEKKMEKWRKQEALRLKRI